METNTAIAIRKCAEDIGTLISILWSTFHQNNTATINSFLNGQISNIIQCDMDHEQYQSVTVVVESKIR